MRRRQACTAADKCNDGSCVGEALKCDDKNDCTKDTCDAKAGCKSTPDDTLKCDDGQTCTDNDACKGGKCAGVGVKCDDNNPCTDDSCDPATKKCVTKDNDHACDDNNPCTEADKCAGGKCAGGKAVACDDKNPCTTDKCDEKTGGCAFTPNDATCDDGNACTSGDKCAKGKCGAGTAKKCDDSNPCTDDACDAKSGDCKSNPKPDKTACDDGSLCTQKDACKAGKCGGEALKCDDDNPCTDDACDAKKGCTTKPNTAKCDDGNPCTTGDACANEDCKAGAGKLDCDDKNACTTDSCDAKKGCVNSANNAKCDDGDACTDKDACAGGTCVGAAKTCDDNNPCTTDSCDKKDGCKHANNTEKCSDGSVCTKDDKCDGKGKCAGSNPLKCDDANPCTDDACINKVGCSFKANDKACDDGAYCTEGDKCSDGKCGAGKNRSCADGNACTNDVCSNAEKKCLHTNAPTTKSCSDSDKCTTSDLCDGKGTCKGKIVECNDENPCTADKCDTKTGSCVYSIDAKLCAGRTVPMTEGIDYQDTDWHFSGNDTTIKWGADATPSSPGKLTGTGSLNFNDGTDYDKTGAKPSGTAIGKFWIDASTTKGKMTLAFYSYNGIDEKETLATYDDRVIELSTDGFKTVALKFTLDHKLHRNKWWLEAFDISTLVGKKFQVRFRFDAKDANYNKGKGWFVDEINVYNGPIATVGAAGAWKDGFATNANGWQFSAKYGNNNSVWAIDATPKDPGAYADNSLNFNNGTNYDGGTTKGQALSPVIDLTKVTAGSVTLMFKSYVDSEVSTNYDKRWIEVTSDAFVGKKTLLIGNGSALQDGWRWEWLDLSSFKGQRVRLRLLFDSVDGLNNKFKGWFVDDLVIDNAPVPSYGDMITCSNSSGWTIAKGNTTGANWAIDKGAITPISGDCALTFDNNTDYKCPTGRNKVSGTATSKTFSVVKPAISGGKVWLSFDAHLDVEASAKFDKLTVQVRRSIFGTTQTFTVPKTKLKAWSSHKFDVSSFAGQTVYVRFSFDSVDCFTNTGKGVAVENVLVRADK